VPVSPVTRELCAARLLGTLDSVSRVSRPRPVSSISCAVNECLMFMHLHNQGPCVACTGLSRCVSRFALAQVQRDQTSTADAAEDAEGKSKPAKRPRLSDQAAAATAQQGDAATTAEPAPAQQQQGAGEQPDYLAGLSAFVRAAEKAGAELAVHGMGNDSTTVRSALREAEETVSKLMAGARYCAPHFRVRATSRPAVNYRDRSGCKLAWRSA